MKLLLAWLLVVVPLAWGVTQSVRKALPLFSTASKPAPTLPK